LYLQLITYDLQLDECDKNVLQTWYEEDLFVLYLSYTYPILDLYWKNFTVEGVNTELALQ